MLHRQALLSWRQHAMLQLLPGAHKLPVAFASAQSTVQAADARGAGVNQRV